MSNSTLYRANDTILQATLADRTGVAIEDATVNLTALTNRHGATPDGIDLPLAMSHTADGVYEAQIAAALDVQVGEVLTGIVTVASPLGDGEWSEKIVVRRREA